MTRFQFLGLFTGALGIAVLSGCSEKRADMEARISAAGIGVLRKDSGRLNRDYFAAPGNQFITLKQSAWPKSFAKFSPRRVTLYRDGAAIAVGGEAGSSEWGVFVVPTGLSYMPPATKTIRYESLAEGIYFYENLP
jgi:hypothetical protein